MIGFSPTPVTSVRFGGMNFDHRHGLPPLTGRRACPHRCCWASAAPILPGGAQLNAVADGAPTRPSQPHVPATPVSWLLAPRHRTIGVNSGVGRHATASGTDSADVDAGCRGVGARLGHRLVNRDVEPAGVFRRAVQADNDRRECRGEEDSGWLAAPGHPGANIMNVTSADVVLGYLSADFSYPIDPRCGQALFVLDRQVY